MEAAPEVGAGVREEAQVEEPAARGEEPGEVKAEPAAPEVQARVEAEKVEQEARAEGEKVGPEARVVQAAVAGPAAVGATPPLQSIRIITTIR